MNNLDVVIRLFGAVEARDLAPMADIYDPEAVIHEADSLPYGGQYCGHRGVAEHGYRYVRAWDSLQTEQDRYLEAEFTADGDRVFVTWKQKAHGADGTALSVPVISTYRLRDGKIVESRMHAFDSAALASFLARERPSGRAASG
jgi:hypothetical protein